MTKTVDEIDIDDLTRDMAKPPVAGHDAWFRKKVSTALEEAKAGKLTYRTLDEVAADYGFDAS